MESIENLAVMFKEESLHEALTPYLVEDEFFGKILKHPLVFSLPYHELENHRINMQYTAKSEAVEKAIAEGNYHTAIYLHERPYRLDAFEQLESEIPDDQYWQLVVSLWTDTENAWQNIDTWKYYWDNDHPNRLENVMEEDELKVYNELPQTVTIYRGYHVDSQLSGLAWTLDRKKAEWFAKRFSHKEPKIASTTIDKSLIKAYLTARNEEEIIVDPETFVNPVKIKKI